MEMPKTRIRRDEKIEKLADEIVADIKNGARRSARELLQKAGYSKAVAGATAKRTLNSESLRAVMEERGFGAEKMQRILSEAGEAKIVTVYQGDATETDAPDHKVRLASLSLAADILGMKKTVVETRNLNVSMDADVLREILGMKTAKPSEDKA